MSFYLDWWMLIGMGIMIALLCKVFYKEDSFLHFSLGILTLVVFITLSVALFAELNSTDHGFLGTLNETFFGMVKVIFADYYAAHPNATSAEFMFTSAEPWIRDFYDSQGWNFENLADLAAPGGQRVLLFFGVIMFTTYPGFLILGVKIGHLIFGRKKGDKGALGFL